MAEFDQYLVFKVEDERLAININKVSEIVKNVDITKLRTKSKSLEGIVNIRNSVMPVINFKQILFDNRTYAEPLFVIVQLFKLGEQVAFMVDEVIEVTVIPEDIIDTPSMLVNNANGFVIGVGKLEKGLTVIVDVDRILSEKEVAALKRMKDKVSSEDH